MLIASSSTPPITGGVLLTLQIFLNPKLFLNLSLLSPNANGFISPENFPSLTHETPTKSNIENIPKPPGDLTFAQMTSKNTHANVNTRQNCIPDDLQFTLKFYQDMANALERIANYCKQLNIPDFNEFVKKFHSTPIIPKSPLIPRPLIVNKTHNLISAMQTPNPTPLKKPLNQNPKTPVEISTTEIPIETTEPEVFYDPMQISDPSENSIIPKATQELSVPEVTLSP